MRLDLPPLPSTGHSNLQARQPLAPDALDASLKRLGDEIRALFAGIQNQGQNPPDALVSALAIRVEALEKSFQDFTENWQCEKTALENKVVVALAGYKDSGGFWQSLHKTQGALDKKLLDMAQLLEKFDSRSADLEEKVAKGDTRLNETRAELTETRARVRKLERETTNANKKFGEIQAHIRKLEENIANANKKLGESQARIQKLEQAVVDNEKNLEDTHAYIRDLVGQLIISGTIQSTMGA